MHPIDDDIIQKYLRLIEEHGVQNKYQFDIFIGDSSNAPPPNESHFILSENGSWTVSDWSRGEQQTWAVFPSIKDALGYSFYQLADLVDFRQDARQKGYDPAHYDVEALIHALKISLGEKFQWEPLERSIEETRIKIDMFTVQYNNIDRKIRSIVEVNRLNKCIFHDTASGFSYVYWKIKLESKYIL